ncbi:MAG: hypothetical protein FWD79_10670 [Desulfobulbus sp.]|nr:hypothetical protein [Desulfobulbus sp.]
MTFPDDSIQSVVNTWWEEQCDHTILKRGSLIFAFVPHVDQVPYTLTPDGRKEEDQHYEAKVNIGPLRIKDSRPTRTLPVAALSVNEGEIWTAFRAKKRPCLVIGNPLPQVDKALRHGMPNILTSPTVVVAPYYGADRDGSRAGYNPELVERIRHAEYPQFMLDNLPITGPKQSILRLDHIQPVGQHYYAWEHSGYGLSEEAVENVLNDWLTWVLSGNMPGNSLILYFQKDIKSIIE